MACLCSSPVIFAQEPTFKQKSTLKPLLFANLASKVDCNRPELEKLVHTKLADQILMKLNDNLILSGEVVEKVELGSGIQKLNIRLTNFGNALLNISIIRQPDNTNRIIGRIIHPKNGDALVIAEENGKYYITKQKMEFFMVE